MSSVSQCAVFVAETLNLKMNWLKNYERIQTIQQQLVWKSVREIEPRNYVPEVNEYSQKL